MSHWILSDLFLPVCLGVQLWLLTYGDLLLRSDHHRYVLQLHISNTGLIFLTRGTLWIAWWKTEKDSNVGYFQWRFFLWECPKHSLHSLLFLMKYTTLLVFGLRIEWERVARGQCAACGGVSWHHDSARQQNQPAAARRLLSRLSSRIQPSAATLATYRRRYVKQGQTTTVLWRNNTFSLLSWVARFAKLLRYTKI